MISPHKITTPTLCLMLHHDPDYSIHSRSNACLVVPCPVLRNGTPVETRITDLIDMPIVLQKARLIMTLGPQAKFAILNPHVVRACVTSQAMGTRILWPSWVLWPLWQTCGNHATAERWQ